MGHSMPHRAGCSLSQLEHSDVTELLDSHRPSMHPDGMLHDSRSIQMGMDVYGKAPSSQTGEYFRNNIWW